MLDNMESVLPDAQGHNPAGVADVTQLLALGEKLLAADERCRMLFTSREPLPAPFAKPKCTVQLVEQVMAQHGWEPPPSDNATTPEEITELVETVNRHLRALVLLAREVAHGVRATTQTVAALMAKLERENAGDRENSLYASVELSLRRLPEEVRERVNRLAVVHGGGNWFILSQVMELDEENTKVVMAMLIDVGMAEEMEYTYLRLDPALPAYLKLQQSPEQIAELETSWGIATMQFIFFLNNNILGGNNILASRLALFELPNLMALLEWLKQQVALDNSIIERSIFIAGVIEQLTTLLGQPKASAQGFYHRFGHGVGQAISKR